MSRIEKGMIFICGIALGLVAAWGFLPTRTDTKVKNHTIVCMVDNQQAIASCTRVERK